jgi:DNA (cytosine-5)-methyltransferase 1
MDGARRVAALRVGSVCSGIAADAVAWGALGWEHAFFAEIAKFPSRVLEQRWPGVPNLGDFTKITERDAAGIDLLVGGTPCQSFSVAGLRGGMDDERGVLALEFLRLAARARPRWIVWENVPGVLSADRGRAFGAFLGGLAELGYGFAYRVLDAQYLGLAQRRKRVFVVGCAGGAWQRAAAVLLERASLRGDPAPSRASREDVAGTLEARARSGGYDPGAHGAASGHLQVANTLRASEGKSGVGLDGAAGGHLHVVARTITTREGGYGIRSDAQRDGLAKTPSADASGRVRLRDPGLGISEDIAPTIDTGTPHAVAFHMTQDPISGETSPTLGVTSGGMGVSHPFGVRRLTPVECERLMGFPDGYTAIDGAKDGPRYAALGNSIAVTVLAWIGRRIALVERLAA